MDIVIMAVCCTVLYEHNIKDSNYVLGFSINIST